LANKVFIKKLMAIPVPADAADRIARKNRSPVSLEAGVFYI
jgi:hypothetical protein